jgi:hypothetical protein
MRGHMPRLCNRREANMDVTVWVQGFVGCVHKPAEANWEHMPPAMRKTRFGSELREQHPQPMPTHTKAINKLEDVGPEGSANGISTEKYVTLCRVSRATCSALLSANRDNNPKWLKNNLEYELKHAC